MAEKDAPKNADFVQRNVQGAGGLSVSMEPALDRVAS